MAAVMQVIPDSEMQLEVMGRLVSFVIRNKSANLEANFILRFTRVVIKL
jgi:hypothetical protein